MPVHGLSDRESVDPRFVEIGRIRKGGEKQGGQVGRDLDYFRYVPNSRYLESAKVFAELYGPEPVELEVFFPLDSYERVFSSWREAYGQNRLCRLRCDGARWHDWIEGDRHFHSEAGRECDLDYRDTENKCPECPCQSSGRLQVILRPMWKAGQIGLITVMTSSINDIAHLASKLVQWEPLTDKPFRLWRAPTRIGVPIQGKRAGKDVSLLHLELADEWMRKMFFEAQDLAAAALLAPPEDLPFDEPPPFEQAAPYDEDDLIVDVVPEVAPSEIKYVNPPRRLGHKNFVEKAVSLKGFANVGEVKAAMLALTQDSGWERSTEWSPTEMWAELQTYAASG
jgi:hypothetical protein